MGHLAAMQSSHHNTRFLQVRLAIAHLQFVEISRTIGAYSPPIRFCRPLWTLASQDAYQGPPAVLPHSSQRSHCWTMQQLLILTRSIDQTSPLWLADYECSIAARDVWSPQWTLAEA